MPGQGQLLESSRPAQRFNLQPLSPASRLDLYENTHEYMWKPVYVRGAVCGIHKFHLPESTCIALPPGAGFPLVCISADGRLRIRPLPVFINWLIDLAAAVGSRPYRPLTTDHCR